MTDSGPQTESGTQTGSGPEARSDSAVGRDGDAEGKFRLTLFGGFTLRDPEGQLITLSLRKAEGLLAFLATEPHQVASRESIASMLWGEFAQAKSRQNLRQTLLDLGRAFSSYEPSPLRIGSQLIALESDRVVVDTEEFVDLVQLGTRESLRRAVELQRGDFLAGLNVRASEFQSWAGRRREEFHELALTATSNLVALQEEEGQIEPAIATAKRALQLDPLREDFHRHLIRLYGKNGMRSAAVSQYRTCVRLLRDELEIDPDQETKRLYRELVGELENEPLFREEPGLASPRPHQGELPTHRRGPEVTWSDPSGVLIGRQSEIERLSRTLLDMGPTAQRCVLIEGELGIGKSHLVQSFLGRIGRGAGRCRRRSAGAAPCL